MSLGSLAHERVWGKEGERRKARVGNVTAGLMVAFALLLDLTQSAILFMLPIKTVGFALVPFTWFVAIIAICSFGVWFALCGVNYFSGKKAAQKLLIAFSAVIIELVPLVDALPAITGGVVAMILASRIEDFAGQAKALEGKSSVQQAALMTSMVRGRRTSERNADRGAGNRMQRGLSTLAARTRDISIENPEAGGYQRDTYDARMRQNGGWASAVRGKTVRPASRPEQEDEASEVS